MTALVVQARLDSSRLPGKALLPLGGKPLLSRVLEALRAVTADTYALACPAERVCVEAFAPLAEQNGFVIVTGPKDDVLARYCNAVRTLHAGRVIRATGDNPFVFADAANLIHAEASGADYAAYSGLPYGAGVESVAAEALLRAEREAVLPTEREHVCPYLYGHGELFLLHRPLAPLRWRRPDIRLTVDTQDDYQRAVRLWNKLAEHDIFSGEAIIAATEAR